MDIVGRSSTPHSDVVGFVKAPPYGTANAYRFGNCAVGFHSINMTSRDLQHLRDLFPVDEQAPTQAQALREGFEANSRGSSIPKYRIDTLVSYGNLNRMI